MMTMRPLPLAALLVASLVGAPALAQVAPGQWSTTVTIDSVDMPGAPPGIANMMRGHRTTVQHCVTPEEAATGPQGLLGPDKSCHFTRFQMTGGKLSSEMVCARGGRTTTATTTGNYTASSLSATSRATESGDHPMTMMSSIASTRTGDCR